MSQGLAVLQQRRATLPHLVVLELGTNGAVTAQNIEQALAILGPQRLLVMITPHNGVDPADDAIITDFAADHRRRMLVLDWNHVADDHPEWFGPDGIHLGNQAGINAFASLIGSVLPYADQPPCI
jgi:hypothetical protein